MGVSHAICRIVCFGCALGPDHGARSAHAATPTKRLRSIIDLLKRRMRRLYALASERFAGVDAQTIALCRSSLRSAASFSCSLLSASSSSLPRSRSPFATDEGFLPPNSVSSWRDAGPARPDPFRMGDAPAVAVRHPFPCIAWNKRNTIDLRAKFARYISPIGCPRSDSQARTADFESVRTG